MSKDKSFDQELVRQLATILTETDLSEIEVEQDDLRIRVVRHSAAPAVLQGLAPPAFAPSLPPVVSPQSQPEAEKAVPPSQDAGGHKITSPMVGTAYHAAEPGAKPFVQVGDQVKKGQTIMIIEAMKHMNHIAADRSGKVKEIFVENGQPVEYGEPLLAIE